MSSKQRTVLIVLLLCSGLIMLWHSGIINKYFSLHALQQKSETLSALVAQFPLLAPLLFILFVTAVVICSIPLVPLCAILGGYLFGAYHAIAYTLTAGALGSALVLWSARHLFMQWRAQERSQRWQHIIDRINEHGAWYIFLINLTGLFPYGVINMLAAFTNVRLIPFIIATVAGSLPMVAVCAFAGRQFVTVNSISDIFSGKMIVLMVIFALLLAVPFVAPLVMKKRN